MGSRTLTLVGAVALLMAAPDVAQAASDWSIVDSPNRGSETTRSNYLAAVSAVDASNVWAVGKDGRGHPLIEFWNGHRWRIQTQPVVRRGAILSAVQALTPTNVWAAGSQPGMGLQPLLLHYDGVSWTELSTVPQGSIEALSGKSSHDLWAVTFQETALGDVQTLDLDHWDGVSWTTVWSANTDITQQFGQVSVKEVNPHDVWVVYTRANEIYGPDHSSTAFSVRWNGTRARKTGGPDFSSNPPVFGELNGVGATSPSDVFEVGSATWADGSSAGIGALYDGSIWTNAFSTTHPGPDSYWFNAVAPASPTDAWAVGGWGDRQSEPTYLLLAHWDGLGWTETTDLSPTNFHNDLNDVTNVPGTDQFWAVGSTQQNSMGVRTLILHCCG